MHPLKTTKMEKYIAIKDTVEKFYSDGNRITTEEYLDFFDSFELNQSEWKLLELIYNTNDNSSTATDLSIELNYKGHQPVNLRFKSIAKKVSEYTGKFPYSKRPNNYWWWTLLATGYKKGKYFYWRLRPELVEALNLFEKNKSNKNFIDWKLTILEWVHRIKNLRTYKYEIITFFDKIINLASYPDRAYFGTSNNAISIVIGHLYLGVYIHSGDDKGVGMIVEKEFKDIEGIVCKPIKSTLTKTSPYKLFWLWIPDMSNLKNILHNKYIWESFQEGSKLVVETPQGKTIREREKKGKIILANLITPKNEIQEIEYNKNLELEISKAQKLSKIERDEKLLEAPEFPEKILIISTEFKRNPHVIIRVLERANGICELCGIEAPFIKIKDGLPFLEVHHIKPLSEGGKDTIENTVALCPNCHREAHFGINMDKIQKKLNIKNSI